MSRVLDELIDAGAEFRLDGDEVEIELPAGVELTDAQTAELRAEKPALAACAHLQQVDRDREAGRVPASYTVVTDCRRCGPVPIFPGCPPEALGCPWCTNRRRGLPVPRVAV